jgi:serine/threonine-protein kinase
VTKKELAAVASDRWHRVTEIFHAALARDAATRDAFVAESCRDDPSLRTEVQALLAAHSDAGSFGDAPVFAASHPHLPAGTILGPYRIDSFIGAGGMGEVYRAEDLRLGRTVAIKILAPFLRESPDLRTRFEREARTISQLTHPHICTLHDVGEHAGSLFLVMEHLEGETLAHRLEKGPLPIEQALTVATEIAEALSAAHRHGFIHRDLKPDNVMLTKSGAKLLDFGLAKLAGNPEGGGAFAQAVSAPTGSAPLTGEGVIVGTLQYMAPEQIEGKPADARTDLWALGAILYEMVTGKRAFEGSSAPSLIGAILEREPAPLAILQPLAPPGLDRIIRACLAKAPDDRSDTAHDLAKNLRWVCESSGDAAPMPVRRDSARSPAALMTVSGIVLGLLAGAAAGSRWIAKEATGPSTAVHSSLIVTETAGLTPPRDVAISPDGRTVVFRASDGLRPRLYARRVDERTATPLEGTEDALGACFSPEGDSIAFMSPNGLFRLKLSGGPPVTILRDPFPFNVGMDWGPDGNIIFSRGSRLPGLWRINANTGGDLSEVVKPEANAIVYLWPRRLPRSDVLTFTRRDQAGLSVVMLRPGATAPETLLPNGSHARYIAATGHLIYQAEGHLLAVRFDPRRLTLAGEPSVVVRDVGNTFGEVGEYDVSATGTLVYLPPAAARLVWKSRNGVTKPVGVPSVGTIGYLALSPDNRRAVLSVHNWGNNQLWLADLDDDAILSRLTPGNNDWFGVFTRNGTRLLFTSAGTDNRFNIYSMPMDRTGPAVRQTNSPNIQRASSVGSGDVFLFHDVGESADVWQQELGRPATARPLLNSSARELEAVFSPDGRWIVYESDISGRPEIYVQRYPDGPARLVSAEGGQRPIWSPSGKEVFYQKATSVFGVQVANGARSGPVVRMFDRSEGRDRNWDAAADGTRFLVAENISPAHINVVANWFEELKAKVSARR